MQVIRQSWWAVIKLSLGFLVCIMIWWILTKYGLIKEVFLPSPQATGDSFLSLLRVDFIAGHLWPSTWRVIIAFLLCALFALPLGIFSARFRWLADAVSAYCGLFRYFPVAAFVPLCILWFGIGDAQKIGLIWLGTVFSLTLLVAADASATPRELIETAQSLGLNRWQVLRRVVLPDSLPRIWDSLRIGAGWAWSYVVLAELVAGQSGVGYFIVQAQRYLQTEKVFAGILFVGLVGLLTDAAFKAAGQRLFRWK